MQEDFGQPRPAVAARILRDLSDDERDLLRAAALVGAFNLASSAIIVGLGTAAETHLKVLEGLPHADVVAGVDTDPARTLRFRGSSRPVYPGVSQASANHSPAFVVIATPTLGHAAVCREVTECFPEARILLEKPASADLASARRVLAEPAVDVAYHMSFSPEVTWSQQAVHQRRPELGDLVSAEMFFADPYYDDFEHARDSLGDSWLDSGINALSVLARFTDITGRRSLRQIGTERQSVFQARLTCDADGSPARALLVTSWHVTDAAKTTRLRYSSGAELLMDHTAIAAYLIRNGEIKDLFGAGRDVPRRERHYRALYQWWLTEGNRTLPPDVSLRLHELLLSEHPRS